MAGTPAILARLSGGLGPNYWKLWGSSAASNLADGIFWIAFPLLAVRLTDSPVLVAGITVVARLPWLVLPLGGLLAGAAIALAFAGSSAAFVVGAAGLAVMRGSFRPAPPERRASVVQDIREGLGYLLSHRLLRTLALMVGVMNLASSAAFAVFVLYAVAPGPMGLDETGFGLLMTTMVVGSLLGSVVVERLEARLGRARLLVVAVLMSGLSIATPAVTANAVIVGVAFAVSGVGVMLWNVVTVSLRQRIVPDRLLGRLNASYRLLAWGSQPLGALVGGAIGEALGLPAVFLLAGIATGLLMVAFRIVTDGAIVTAEAEGAAATAA